MEKNIKNYSEYLQVLFETSHEGMVLMDSKGKIVAHNLSFCRLMGMEGGDLCGSLLHSFVEESSVAKLNTFLKALTQGYQRDWEMNIRCATGTVYPVLMTGFSKDEGIFVTLKKELEEMLQLQENLMVINNELTNTRRELEKKNVQLEAANSKIREYCNELTEKNNLIQIELNVAKKVQKSMLSRIITDYKNLTINKKYSPASNVGGDMYDVAIIQEDKIGILICDVCGHGMGAALVMGVLKNMFRNYYKSFLEPNQLLKKMNQEFVEIFSHDGFHIYATAFYIILDLKEKTITYSSAGHPFPFIYSENGKSLELKLPGVPLGIMGDTVYENKKSTFDDGDRIFLFTDGLENFLEELKDHDYCIKNYTWGNISYYFRNLCTKLDEKTCKQKDDVSLMVVEIQ
ncbi:SpoIIE family protein phosphatase [Alkaliphilus hydrothermalis]|uniref:PAS domain S-box-containing protein n=1 Tax=Alkaliphilus hydrothermalis TaxID=1482730 RepID=A0ABS2NT47_9FIRM|nr:SpoIIE family protein phosphatase [Alkaliphilus hydrothermalis]MBM7616144.1 PAS domain S-box-containing protein [Alkaliphilus hydrothermalis]